MVGQRRRQSARRAVSSLVKRALMSNMMILRFRRSGIRLFVHGPCMSFMRNKKSVKQIFYDDFCKIDSMSLQVLYELHYGVINLILIKRGLCCTFSLR